jgi:AbrB family looped-hinge helix DNA binding protein
MIEATSKISSKGQVVIPKEIRKQFDAKEGDSLKFTVSDTGEIKLEIVKREAILDLFGSIQAKGDTEDFEKVKRETMEDRMKNLQGKSEV